MPALAVVATRANTVLAPLQCRIAVDTSDEPLAALADSLERAAPDLLKPNAEELASITAFGAPDGPADLVFMIAAPESGGAEHMKLPSSLARALVRPDFVESLRNASTAEDVVNLVEGVVNPPPAKPPAKPTAPTAETTEAKPKSVVAITACPTGIAHTNMAADALAAVAKRSGVNFSVETQGSSGSTPLSASTIADADAVIFATDVG